MLLLHSLLYSLVTQSLAEPGACHFGARQAGSQLLVSIIPLTLATSTGVTDAYWRTEILHEY